ncbi:MAG: cysteine synthase A [Mediterranea massiliensis]|nr:cysteine synthase A [Mediterranea massiliensis]
MKIANNLLELVGNTPLMQVSAFSKQMELATPLWVKIEAFNPSGSVKARAALAMVEDAEQAGLLKPGATIIEPTSGNTGIGLAMVATVKGYHLMLTMPETMSIERRKLLAAYGAELVLTPGSEGMAGAIAKAEELHRMIPGSYIPGQFDNPANPAIHERTTAREIWADTDGRITAFVAGVGTGGTLCGTGRCLKQLNPAIRVVGVEPASSPVLQGGVAGPHGLQGIGANFVPANYDAEVVDEVMGVSDEEAFEAARTLARTEGLLVGISSGAALAAAVRLSRSMTDATGIVVLLPDSGERYLSTGLFD